ncbi:hypothetical protein ACLB2K_035109 [Fragaria x ananassa]
MLCAIAVDSCLPTDLAALEAVKASLTESNLGLFNTWFGTDCCLNWYGVSCDPSTRRVVDLNLRGESEDPILSKSGQSGSIAPEICNLDSLTTLVLADWKGLCAVCLCYPAYLPARLEFDSGWIVAGEGRWRAPGLVEEAGGGGRGRWVPKEEIWVPSSRENPVTGIRQSVTGVRCPAAGDRSPVSGGRLPESEVPAKSFHVEEVGAK